MQKFEYEILKNREMDLAKQTIENLKKSKDKFVRFPNQRPIVDLKQMITSTTKLYPDKVAFMQKFSKNADFTKITYSQALSDINALGTMLINLGLKDKRIAVCGDNCYQWAVSYLSVVCGTGVVVPLDKELSAKELEQLTIEANVVAVLCSDKLEQKFNEIKANKTTDIEFLINFDKETHDETSYSFFQLIKDGKELIAMGDTRFLDAQIFREELAILLFTSGTTGISKGVMLSHRNIVQDLMPAASLFDCTHKDVFFSILPLHHTYECTCGFLMPFYQGGTIGYCRGLKYLQKDLAEIKPTIFLGVPLIIEALYKKIWKNITSQGKENAIKKAISMNNKLKKIGLDFSKKLFKDIHNVFGGDIKSIIVGGAAINPDILQFFRDIGIVALQGYGLTECSPMTALNPDIAPKNTSCGKIIPGFQVKIEDKNEDGFGEICVKGPHVMLGYYNNPEATSQVLKDGWYYTGDIGYIDDEDYIYITGRKKNVIITKNGKNVYPEELEYYLSNIPYVSESMVWADEAKQGEDVTIVASIYPDMDEVCAKIGQNPTPDDIQALLWKKVDEINSDLPFFKKIKRISVRDTEFNKNTSKKIRRFVKENKQ